MLTKKIYHSNNKQIGTAFEKRLCEILKRAGFWVHFMNPDRSGSQPVDVIAVRGNKPYLIECKTTATERFSFQRIRENQRLACELWTACGNSRAYVMIEYNEKIYAIPYTELREKRTISVLKDAYEINFG